MFDFFKGLIEKVGVKLISDFSLKLMDFIKEVFQEIIEAYRDYKVAKCIGYTDVMKSTAIFQMPEE